MATQALSQQAKHEKGRTLKIRPATDADFPAIYQLFQQVLKEGLTYSYIPEEMTETRSRQYWMQAEGTHCHVAEVDGQFAGCFALRPNRTGRANHVANASFIVHPDHRGKGAGRALGLAAIELARSLGYKAVQYNFVVSANEVAVKLWKSLGYSVIGTMPAGFQHPTLGLVDVYMMHRYL